MKRIICEEIKLVFPILDPEVPKDIPLYSFNNNLTNEFKKIIYKYYKTQEVEISPNLKKESFKLFNEIKIYRRADKDKKGHLASYSDHFFENFTPIISDISNSRKRYYNAVQVWKMILDIVEEWESINKNYYIHKGTPYYFASASALQANDIDSAFIFMGLALEQDKITSVLWKKRPAYNFLVMNDTHLDQYLKVFIDHFMGFIKVRLNSDRNPDNYSKKRKGKLLYTELRKKFFENSKIQEETKYYFSYTAIKLWYLRMVHKSRIKDDIISPVIFSQTISSYLIIIESILSIIYRKSRKDTLKNYLNTLAKKEKWNQGILDDIQKDIENNFDNWLIKHLTNDTLFDDFCIFYGLRNFSFHYIKSQKILWENYTKILQSVLNCFFKSLEII